LSGTTPIQYQKGKTSLDFTEARDSEWQWHQLEHMQVCTSLQTDNHASTQQLSFLQAGCPSSRPSNSVKALKAVYKKENVMEKLKKTKTDMLGRNDNGKSDHLRLVVFSGLCRTSVVAVLM